METKQCSRCEGKGRLAHEGHVLNGICFKCGGKGIVAVTKRIKVSVVSWWVSHAEWFDKGQPRGVHCSTAEKAEELASAWKAMGLIDVNITTSTSVVTKEVVA